MSKMIYQTVFVSLRSINNSLEKIFDVIRLSVIHSQAKNIMNKFE